MKKLKTEEHAPDLIDYALMNVGSYNVIFKHAKWVWALLWFSTRSLYIGLIWVNFVFGRYLSIPPQTLWSLVFLVPVLVFIFVLPRAAESVIQKHYPQYRNEKDWGEALRNIERTGLIRHLRILMCLDEKGIRTATEMVFREEQSERRFSFFTSIFIGGFIPLSANLLGWLLEHKTTDTMTAFHVFLSFVILVATFGFIVFMEELWAQTKSDSKMEILKRTRRILDRLFFEVKNLKKETKRPGPTHSPFVLSRPSRA